MASWLTGGAKEWNAQIRDTWNRAATSVQRFAETTELHEFGEHLVAHAQRLAEQSEVALRETADKVVKEVASLPFLHHDGPGGEVAGQELVKMFEREAHALDLPDGRQIGNLFETFQTWEARLQNAEARLQPPAADASPGGAEASPSDGARQSRQPEFRALLLSRVLHIVPGALVRFPAGLHVLRAAGGNLDEQTGLHAEAGQRLLSLLGRASGAPVALLKQLLALLADAADESRSGDQSADTGAKAGADASQDMQWVLALLSAVLMDVSELALHNSRAVKETVDTALATSAPAAGEGGQPAAAPSEESPDGSEQETTLNPGTKVWARYPGDGSWYRAEIKSAGAVVGRVDIAWLRAGMDESNVVENEFLASTGADELQFLRVEAVDTKPVEQPRPAAVSAAPEEHWQHHLDSAEAHGRGFRLLRTACMNLAALPAGSTGSTAAQPLASLAEHLAALREDSELRAQALAGQVVECANQGKEFEDQLTTSSKSFEEEIETLHQQQEALQENVKELQKQREELLARLKDVEDQLASAQEAVEKAAQREHQIRDSAKRVASELKRELGVEEAATRKVAERRRLLLEAGAASVDVESLLAARGEEANALAQECSDLLARRPEVVAACLSAERARERDLEELFAGWHVAIWGPEAKRLVRDSARVAAIRSLHQRAAGVVEKAWREMVQLAAETLGGASTLGEVSEVMSRSAERYKSLRQQLEANLERLAALEEAEASPKAGGGELAKAAPGGQAAAPPPGGGDAGGTGTPPAPASAGAAAPGAAASSPTSSQAEGAVSEEELVPTTQNSGNVGKDDDDAEEAE